MHKTILLLVTALVITGCQSPAKGQNVTRELHMDSFTRISLNMSSDIYIKQGENLKVTVEGKESLLNLLNTEVKDGKWVIEFMKNNIREINNLVFHITVPKLEEVYVNGSGDIIGKGTFSAAKFSLGINGSGNVKLAMESDALRISINGSGDIALTGRTGYADIRINGSGDVKSPELKCDTAKIGVTGSGDVSLHVNNKLEVRITGSGDVRYTGDPEVVIRRVGSGDVIKQG